MVDVSSSWVCQTEGQCLSDVLLFVDIKDNEDLSHTHNQNCSVVPVLLSQPEDSAPCLLSLKCRLSGAPSVIKRVVLVSQARTVEVYDQNGEYCGTVRGEREDTQDNHSSDSEPFYRKELVLNYPAASCEVKLLSLGGRRCVQVLSITVGLQTVCSSASVNPGIDMQQVQSMMQEMGTTLSPGAQNLMEMVHFQQQNQTSSLGSLFPLLMGGRALSLPQPPAPQFMSLAPEAPPTQNGGMSHDSSPASTDSTCSESSEAAVNPARLTEMMSQLMNGRGQALSSAPDLLPVLQSVCGHVTQLRLDNSDALKQVSNGTCVLDPVMEKRLEELEVRLKQHFDARLDALEQKLESALSLALLNQGYSGLPAKNMTEDTCNQAQVNSN